MTDKQKHSDKIDNTQNHQTEAKNAHSKMLGEVGLGKPTKLTDKADSSTTTIKWPGGGQRTMQRDDQGKIIKIVESDGSYYQRDASGLNNFSHMKGQSKLSEGSIEINEKTKVLTYHNIDNQTLTTLKADGSALVRKHLAGFGDHNGPVLEIHNPPKSDGTTGDVRKFTYDADGRITGYSVISANKNLCSSWKTNDGIHWRKVDDKGNYIKNQDKEKDSKNILIGRMYVSADGTFAFDNQRKGTDEAPHWTVVSTDGQRHERVTNLDQPVVAHKAADAHELAEVKQALKATDDMRALQTNIVKAHFDEIKPNNPVGWMGYVGKDDLDLVLTDANRSAEQKLAAAILKKCMEIHGINLIHANELNGKVFKETLARIPLSDIAYDQRNKS